MQIDFAVREADFPKADSLYRSQPGPLLDTLQYRTLQAFKTNDVAKQEALFRAYEQDTAIAAGMIGLGAMLVRAFHSMLTWNTIQIAKTWRLGFLVTGMIRDGV